MYERVAHLEDLLDKRTKQSDKRLVEIIALRSIIRKMFPVMESGMSGKINGTWDGRQWAYRSLTDTEQVLLEQVLQEQ